MMRKKLQKTTMKILSLTIVILCMTSINLMAQKSVTVSGKVTSSEGESLPGASVIVQGTTVGIITNLDGDYSIEVEQGKVLEFSFIGYNKQEVKVGNQTKVNVSLQLDVTGVDEVVVVGYGNVRKVDITGSVATVDVGSIETQKPLSVQQALQGKVAGLRVISGDGAPGADIKMEIRGMSSINAGGEPLVIIDGLPGGDLKNINPEDVESISVLKDASSTAIYGSKGANGVVLVTTKRGTVGKTNLEVKALYGIQSLPKELDFQNPTSFMTTKLAKMFMNTSTDYNSDNDPDPNYSYYRAWKDKWYLDPERVTDWQGLIFRPGFRKEYSVTLTSGNEKVRNATAFGFNDNEGIVITTGSKKATLRSNTDFVVNDKLTIKNNISLAYRRKTGEQDFNNDGVYVRAGQFSPMVDKYMNFATIRQWENSGNLTVNNNPYLLLTERFKTQANFSLLGNLEVNYEILKGLSFIGSAGGSYGNNKLEDFSTLNLNNAWSSKGDMSITRDFSYSYRLLSQLVYDLKVGDHKLNATAAFEVQEYGNDQFGQSYNNFNQILGQYGIHEVEFSTTSPKPDYDFNKTNIASYIGRVQYGFLDRYLFSATVRADGSSKFGSDNAWATFPALAFGWRASEESFIKNNISWLSNLKLRSSWGKAGNDNIDSYLSMSTYGTNQNSAVFGQDRDQIIVPYHPNQIPNFFIAWETTTETNLGLDFGLFKNRVNGTFDWYNRVTTNMLLDVELPAIVGVERQTQNKGSLRNRGWEFMIDGTIIEKKKFQWQAGINITSNQTMVLKLQDEKVRDFQDVNTLIQVGLPLGVKYGYMAEGINNTNEYIRNGMRTQSVGGGGWGKPVVTDITGDGKISPQDQTVIFNPQATFNGGFNTKLSYGHFELYMLFRGSYGSDVYNQNLGELGNTVNLSRAMLQKLADEMWLPNNQDGTYLGGSDFPSNDFSSFLIEDGSYLKFATLNLSFEFPQEWINSVKLSGARLSYTMDNVANWTNYSGFDPDVNSGGNFRYYGTDRSAYPYSRTHLFTLNLTL